jgi:hypothetical protein
MLGEYLKKLYYFIIIYNLDKNFILIVYYNIKKKMICDTNK